MRTNCPIGLAREMWPTTSHRGRNHLPPAPVTGLMSNRRAAGWVAGRRQYNAGEAESRFMNVWSMPRLRR